MRCCGTDGQTIDLRTDEAPLRMVRCGRCSRREWQISGRVIAVEEAFVLLGRAYRAAPRQARAVRARTAGQTAARAALRAAQTLSAPPARSAGGRDVDRDDLAGMLQGWSVLGATG